ncbi:MAG: ABC transporter substrate-binding protein [Propioniciclava sp.]|uniref:ABC transporter substrate-binding protein n=1 Tax=Propioniciclava sp. TaxID=2038686 RepID=UPI0039E28595
MKTLRLGACLGTTLAIVLTAGCTTQQPPVPSNTPMVPANAPHDVNATSRDRISDGGLLRFGVRSLPAQWNPFHAEAADADTQRVLAPLAPTHFTLDPAGRATPNPDFITGADARHDGNTVVTLQLNANAVWGDGEPLTAADWVATWEWARSGQASPAAVPGWAHVTEVRPGWSPREVVLTYAGIEPDWAEPLVRGPLRAGSLQAASWTDYTSAHYASPFVVAHVDRPQGLVTLERNPRWWGDAPKLERIMFRTVQPEAFSAAFLHNELDLWETGLSADALQQSRAAADTSLRTAPGTRGRALAVKPRGPLADAGVRRALVQGLDRAALLTAALPSETSAATTAVWSNPLLLPTQPGYVDQARATGLTADPAAAARALDEAGWTLEGGVRTKNGQPLTLTFEAAEGDVRASAEFEELLDQWAGLGVTLNAVASDADLAPRSLPISPFPLATLPAEATATATGRELSDKVSAEVDPVRRADTASQLARLLWQEATLVTLYQEPQYVAVRAGLANLGAPGYGTTEWEDVGWTS